MLLRLGDIGKDTITGFQGKIIAMAEYITGCNQAMLQPTTLKEDGEIMKAHWFDVGRIQLVEQMIPAEPKTPAATKGGPQPHPPASRY